jgi:hypothetical protein
MLNSRLKPQTQRIVDIKDDETITELGIETKEPEVIETDELKQIPPKELFNYNLKQLKSFKKIRQSYKLKNLKYTFLTDMKIVLKEYKPTDKDNQYNDELLIEVLNIAEEYFINKDSVERETYKKDCVIELLMPYFNNDRQLLLKTIQLVNHKIKKGRISQKIIFEREAFFFTNKFKYQSELVILRHFLFSLIQDFLIKLILNKLIVISPLLILL